MENEIFKKLAAIVFTDIANFTSLSAFDEYKAYQLLEKQRSILKPIVKKYGGNWLKEMGDSLLLTFQSTQQAVKCAIEIQQTVKNVDDLNLRIGIHQGDVFVKDNDVFGDDVNIASRIEPFSAVGGITISEKVNNDISGNPEIMTKYIGKPKFKGVLQEVRLYSIISHDLPQPVLSEISAKLEKRKSRWAVWLAGILAIVLSVSLYELFHKDEVPSLGILYMENLGVEDNEFWARGITEDLIIEMSSAGLIRVAPFQDILRYRDTDKKLQDIAQELHVKYLLTSSIQKIDSLFKFRIQLINSKSGKNIYAKRIEKSDREAGSIISDISPEILKRLGIKQPEKHTFERSIDPTAYELYLKGKYTYDQRSDYKDKQIAIDLLNRALEIDSTLIEAKLKIGQIYEDAIEWLTAMEIYKDCLEQSKALDDLQNTANSISSIGDINFRFGQYDSALIWFLLV